MSTGIRKLIVTALFAMACHAFGRETTLQAGGLTCKDECWFCFQYMGGTFETGACDEYGSCTSHCWIGDNDYIELCEAPASYSPGCS